MRDNPAKEIRMQLMSELIDLCRARLRRELNLHMRRKRLNEWQLVQMIDASRNIPMSTRSGSPNMIPKTISGLLAGKKTQENSLDIIANFLIHDTDLHFSAVTIDQRTIKAAKESMHFVRGSAQGQLSRSHLASYAGLFTISGDEGGQITLNMIIDHEPFNNVLLVRCVLRDCQAVDFLEGYATPQDDQLILHLRHCDYGTAYSINVPATHDKFSQPDILKTLMGYRRPSWKIACRLMFPSTTDGMYATDPYQPTYLYEEKNVAIRYYFQKWQSQDMDEIDVFRDNYDMKYQNKLYNSLPSKNAIHEGYAFQRSPYDI